MSKKIKVIPSLLLGQGYCTLSLETHQESIAKVAQVIGFVRVAVWGGSYSPLEPFDCSVKVTSIAAQLKAPLQRKSEVVESDRPVEVSVWRFLCRRV